MLYFRNIIIFIVLATLASCLSNNKSKEDVQKFAEWEIDSLTEISPMTPVQTEGLIGTHLAQKWSLTVMVEGRHTTEFPDGSFVNAPNQSMIDKQQYIDFNKDGSFVLSITESACSELKNKIKEMFGVRYTKSGLHRGTYKCYEVLWCNSTCDGTYGVVLFDEEGRELCRYAFVFVEINGHEFTLDEVGMKDSYEADISSSISFYLHKQ
jgi:hypothetical protein